MAKATATITIEFISDGPVTNIEFDNFKEAIEMAMDTFVVDAASDHGFDAELNPSETTEWNLDNFDDESNED